MCYIIGKMKGVLRSMTKQELKKLIDIAAGRIPADVVIKNCRVVDVYSGTIRQGDCPL